MPHIPGHYRNGRWVRPHYRRSTPAAARSAGHIRVRRHRRQDGTLVRGHWRNAGPAPVPTSQSGSDWDWVSLLGGFLLILLVIGAISQA